MPPMLRWIGEKGLSVLGWTTELSSCVCASSVRAQWLPEEHWPATDDSTLLESLSQWLLPQMSAVRDLRSLQAVNLTTALLHLLTWSQRQRLDSALPNSLHCADRKPAAHSLRCR